VPGTDVPYFRSYIVVREEHSLGGLEVPSSRDQGLDGRDHFERRDQPAADHRGDDQPRHQLDPASSSDAGRELF